jgi:hypothetical protein
MGSAWGDMPEGHFVIVRPRAEVVAQAEEALDAIEAANGGTMPPTLREAYDVAPAAYALLVEALVQLGADVDLDTQRLAGLRTIDELLG